MRDFVAGLLLLVGAQLAFAVEPIAHMEVRGEGDTHVVLIHNTLADWGVWESFMERNAERYTMYAPRLAGAGGSEAMEIPDGNPLDDMVWTRRAVDALEADLDARGVDRVYIVGHGIGGVIGMTLASRSPERVEGVVLVDTMPAHPLTLHGFRFDHTERVSYLLDGFLATTSDIDPIAWRVQWSDIASRQTQHEAESERLKEMAGRVEFETWRRWMTELQVPDMIDELDASGVPVLGVGAASRGIVELFGTRVMVEEFWNLAFDDVENSQVTLFDDALHYIFLDRPEAFDEMFETFVEGEEIPLYSYREEAE